VIPVFEYLGFVDEVYNRKFHERRFFFLSRDKRVLLEITRTDFPDEQEPVYEWTLSCGVDPREVGSVDIVRKLRLNNRNKCEVEIAVSASRGRLYRLVMRGIEYLFEMRDSDELQVRKPDISDCKRSAIPRVTLSFFIEPT